VRLACLRHWPLLLVGLPAAWPPHAWDVAALVAFALGGLILVAVVAAYQRASSHFRHERQRLEAALRAANAAVWEIDANGSSPGTRTSAACRSRASLDPSNH
jgi:hypothetical protein